MKTMVISAKNKLIKADLMKIAKGAGIAAAGAIATVLLEMIPNVDFGAYTVMIVALNSVICNTILKFATATKY